MDFAARFVPGLLCFEGVPARLPVVEQIVGLDEQGRLRRQILLHESPTASSDRLQVNVLLPGPGIYEVRNALHEWSGETLYVGKCYVYVAARGARVFERAEVEAVARTLDAPRRAGRPRSWLKRRAVDGLAEPLAERHGIEDAGPGLPRGLEAPAFSALGVGDVVMLQSARWGHESGERALCYEAFELAERAGRAFVFADGLTVGCDEGEFERHFHYVRHETSLSGLRVRDPRDLVLALAEGRFAVAFASENTRRAQG